MSIPAKFVLFGLLSLAIYSCQSLSDQIVKSFDKVNKSIERSNAVVSAADSLAYYHRDIDAKITAGAARKSDSLYERTQQALKLFARAKDSLKTADPSGGNREIATSLLLHTSLGDSIRNAVREVARLCHANLLSPGKEPALDRSLANALSLVKDHWEDGFTNEPTVAALTFLSAFESQCTEAATLTLADIDTHLGKP